MASGPMVQIERPARSDLINALHKNTPKRFRNAEKLLEQGADINQRSYFGDRSRIRVCGPLRPVDSVTALYDAATRGDFDAVVFLLENGADVHKRIRTCVSPSPVVLRPRDAPETLRGLDAMRTSKEPKIVALAERLYGIETSEDKARRLSAFDNVPRYYLAFGRRVEHTSSTPRVKSVPKSRQNPNVQLRYNLRKRK